MAEYERIREKALLAPDEKDMIINMATKLTDPMPLIEVMRFGDAIAEAQLDKVLKTDGICIKSDDQGLPNIPYSPLHRIPVFDEDGYPAYQAGIPVVEERKSECFIGYSEAQQDMLNEGWVKCLKKE